MLSLPTGVRACLFDLDGVLTPTAAAWKETFDQFLRRRAQRGGEAFRPFDPVSDDDEYVDGKPRADGTRSFPASRRIALSEGQPDDPPTRESIHGLSMRKDAAFSRRLRSGVKPFEGSVRYLRAARDAGLRRAVVSSSKHYAEILAAAGIDDLVGVGVVAEREGLCGKPATTRSCARPACSGSSRMRQRCSRTPCPAVAAGRAAGVGYVVRVDRAELLDRPESETSDDHTYGVSARAVEHPRNQS